MNRTKARVEEKGIMTFRRDFDQRIASALRRALLPALILVLILAAPAFASDCGGPGQRACCNFNGEFSNNSLACNDGLVQLSGCIGDCACSGGIITQIPSVGTCVQPRHCGGKGERACCVVLNESAVSSDPTARIACSSGLVEVPGCAGDCTCGGSVATGQVSTSSCTVMETIAEPATNSTPQVGQSATPAGTPWTLPPATLPTGPECPPTGLCGFADLHVHMFASMAHGGAGIAGEAWDQNGVNAALGEDFGTPQILVNKHGNQEPFVDGNGGFLPACPDYLRNSPLGNLCAGQLLYHGDHTAMDSVVGGGSNDAAFSNLGAPLFNGWPKWTSVIHQQVYWKWLERAWLGGMRLMVLDAVTNETFCKSNPRLSTADCTLGMTFIDNQLNAANNFQTWLDNQFGGAGQGWFRIVTSPQQAISVIQHGKLAVVLGIEADNLFNCHFRADLANGPLNGEGPTCSSTYVQGQLQKYYNMGVRHIFPVHDFDNAFGTTATWSDALNIGNYVEEGRYWDAINCPDPGYGFTLGTVFTGLEALLAGFDPAVLVFPPYAPFTTGSCHNGPGLTDLGRALVAQAMQLGMIVDVDHMSIQAFNDSIGLAKSQNYPGIAASHVIPYDLYQQPKTHERMRTAPQLQSIAGLGGMIALITKDNVQDTGQGWCPRTGPLPAAQGCPFGAIFNSEGDKNTVDYNGMTNSCRYSTTQWAEVYRYSADQMGGPVGIGRDFNGVAGHLGPRFGSDACGGDETERVIQEHTSNRLQYPFTVAGFGTFDRQVTGQRTFDYNVDGLAHIGLLPDMIADLKNVGLTDTQLQPLFGSAQAYINMWLKTGPAAPFFTSAPATATFGVGSPGTVTITAQGNPAPTYQVSGTLPPGFSYTTTSAGLVISGEARVSGEEGTYPLTITAANNVSPNAVQNLNLVISTGGDFLTPASADFVVGRQNSFSFATGGNPTGINLSCIKPDSPLLDAGVTYNPQTHILSGNPAPGSEGAYPCNATAFYGGTGQDYVIQPFILYIGQVHPTITSATSATFSQGVSGRFQVTATGFPAPAFSETGALPSGIQLDAKTGLLGGTPTAAGVFPITITAANGVNPAATQKFTLTVKGDPVLSWPSPAPISFGTALDKTQLNATSNYPGSFTYNPTFGAVLPPGNGQQLSATFTPSDPTAANSKTVTTTINVNPIPSNAPTVNLIVTEVASRVYNVTPTDLQVVFTVANAGSATAQAVVANVAALNSFPGIPIVAVTDIPSGKTATFTFIFQDIFNFVPPPGTTTVLTVSGLYNGGTFAKSFQIVLP
jgi:microsomal dipeptidase-like Zn-dependent dipeptidase